MKGQGQCGGPKALTRKKRTEARDERELYPQVSNFGVKSP
jgi:hypothetical protein